MDKDINDMLNRAAEIYEAIWVDRCGSSLRLAPRRPPFESSASIRNFGARGRAR
jgi:hypothetical protein